MPTSCTEIFRRTAQAIWIDGIISRQPRTFRLHIQYTRLRPASRTTRDIRKSRGVCESFPLTIRATHLFFAGVFTPHRIQPVADELTATCATGRPGIYCQDTAAPTGIRRGTGSVGPSSIHVPPRHEGVSIGVRDSLPMAKLGSAPAAAAPPLHQEHQGRQQARDPPPRSSHSLILTVDATHDSMSHPIE